MKAFTIISLIVLISSATFAQTLADIVAHVKQAQQSTKLIYYTIKRTDTLVTGDVRSMSGSVNLKPNPGDGIFGFLFHAQLYEDKSEVVYDGHQGYYINNQSKTYAISAGNSNIQHLLWGGGGWLVMPDLVAIDTSRAMSFNLSQDADNYYLKINYADFKPEDVTQRYKTLTISKTTWLPIAIRSHQETLGKVQDLYYQITRIHINDSAFDYDFSLPFLKSYQQQVDTKAPPPPVFVLKNKAAPQFVLTDLQNNDKQVSLADYKGKVVLIDFWEVWCGPCVESMPKVQRLYDAYKDKGLQVLGIVNDTKQADPARLLMKKKRYSFKTLLGNAQLKKDYKLNGSVPLYMVIDKQGQINYITQGYSAELEDVIKRAIE